MSVEENIQFTTMPLSTGPRLHYVERGDPKGDAIVFLHGYSDSWFSFSRVLPLLAPSYHAFALTHRGHGDSDKPECCYTPEDFAADVDAFMDAVGIEEATIVGASTGALFAQGVALRYPRRLSRLVLVGAQTPANDDISGLVEEVQSLFLEGRRDEAIAAVPTRLAEDVSLVGPVAKIRDDLAMWDEAGVTMLVVMATPGTDLRRIAEAVLGA